jgi:hypothetical protein
MTGAAMMERKIQTLEITITELRRENEELHAEPLAKAVAALGKKQFKQQERTR